MADQSAWNRAAEILFLGAILVESLRNDSSLKSSWYDTVTISVRRAWSGRCCPLRWWDFLFVPARKSAWLPGAAASAGTDQPIPVELWLSLRSRWACQSTACKNRWLLCRGWFCDIAKPARTWPARRGPCDARTQHPSDPARQLRCHPNPRT